MKWLTTFMQNQTIIYYNNIKLYLISNKITVSSLWLFSMARTVLPTILKSQQKLWSCGNGSPLKAKHFRNENLSSPVNPATLKVPKTSITESSLVDASPPSRSCLDDTQRPENKPALESELSY
eukprot:GHVP01037119.1.p2 GENE.GHVP01037119.1~~GHVP01037119.1.p2  ORF type:complete len:123 (+),score=11.79 GHVP01037119.1:795-1163(+)